MTAKQSRGEGKHADQFGVIRAGLDIAALVLNATGVVKFAVEVATAERPLVIPSVFNRNPELESFRFMVIIAQYYLRNVANRRFRLPPVGSSVRFPQSNALRSSHASVSGVVISLLGA
jgi:hypothetical protein